MFVVLALYQFTRLADPAAVRQRLLRRCRSAGLVGTFIVAAEGINGTVAGTRPGIDRLRSWLAAELGIVAPVATESDCRALPFHRLKVLHKAELVKLGDCRAAPLRQVGAHVDPADWNRLLRDPTVTVVDTRNAFEVAIGSFVGAIDPATRSFGDFPRFVAQALDPVRTPRIAMFCTGGIRCEKASSLLLSLGFEQVYQLRGGILRYLQEVPAAASRWRGECFVFDQRVALVPGLAVGSYQECHGCKLPVSAADRQSPHYEPGVSCPGCYPTVDPGRRKRLRERRRQMALAAARGQHHLGGMVGRGAAGDADISNSPDS